MLRTQQILSLSLLVGVIGLTACQPKDKPEQKPQTEQKSAVPQQREPVLEAKQVDVIVTMPECKGNTCPQFDVKRLSSNYAFVDDAVDQAVLSSLAQILDVSEMVKKPVENSEVQSKKDTAESQPKISRTNSTTTPIDQQNFDAQVQRYADVFLDLDREIKTLSANQQISLTVAPKVLQSKGPLVTVVLNTSSYLGGAHGSASQQYYNFDLVKKQQLQLKDILNGNQQAVLEKKFYSAFQNWVMENKLASSVEEYEQVWKFKLSNNFFLAKQGLILQYGEYEIGPYVVGLPRLVVPYSELQDVIKTEYLPPDIKTTAVPATPEADK
ncbi:RsiV family protein [Acinetobacter radioresistens]|uniref:RsiV family protein n=1 Tax=Acinetobacter radioresistens TaxID=40216 RepID=UPI0032630E58